MPKTKTTFEPGHPYYPRKDAPFNKKELNEFLTQAWPVMVDEFWKLNGNKKWDVFLELIKYNLPKLSAIQFEDTTTKNTTIELLRSVYGKLPSSKNE